MTDAVTQYGVITVSDGHANPQVSQLALTSVQGPPHVPTRISQIAVIRVVSNNRGYLQLSNPIGLNCWQPCTAYATPSLIVRLDGGVNGNG